VGKGGFKGGQYSPHCLAEAGGFRITPCDPTEMQHVADENHHPHGLTRAQVTRLGQMSTIDDSTDGQIERKCMMFNVRAGKHRDH